MNDSGVGTAACSGQKVLLDLISPGMFRDSMTDEICVVTWSRGRNGMQTRRSWTRHPTAVSTRKRGRATFPYPAVVRYRRVGKRALTPGEIRH